MPKLSRAGAGRRTRQPSRSRAALSGSETVPRCVHPAGSRLLPWPATTTSRSPTAARITGMRGQQHVQALAGLVGPAEEDQSAPVDVGRRRAVVPGGWKSATRETVRDDHGVAAEVLDHDRRAASDTAMPASIFSMADRSTPPASCMDARPRAWRCGRWRRPAARPPRGRAARCSGSPARARAAGRSRAGGASAGRGRRSAVRSSPERPSRCSAAGTAAPAELKRPGRAPRPLTR